MLKNFRVVHLFDYVGSGTKLLAVSVNDIYTCNSFIIGMFVYKFCRIQGGW